MKIAGVNDTDSLTVYRGDNILRTCFQYKVIGDGDRHVMTVKFYCKTLDIIGRESTKPVGSRCF